MDAKLEKKALRTLSGPFPDKHPNYKKLSLEDQMSVLDRQQAVIRYTAMLFQDMPVDTHSQITTVFSRMMDYIEDEYFNDTISPDLVTDSPQAEKWIKECDTQCFPTNP